MYFWKSSYHPGLNDLVSLLFVKVNWSNIIFTDNKTIYLFLLSFLPSIWFTSNSHMCCENRNIFSWTLGRIAFRSFMIIPPCLNMGREIHVCVCYVEDLACFFLLFSLSKVPEIQIFTAFEVYNSRIVRKNGDMRTCVWFIIFFLPLKYWRKEN